MNPEILPITKTVLKNLSVEELEERLEMQMIRVPAAQDWCAGVDCSPNCGCDGACLAECNTNCTSLCFCKSWCLVDCAKLLCFTDVPGGGE